MKKIVIAFAGLLIPMLATSPAAETAQPESRVEVA